MLVLGHADKEGRGILVIYNADSSGATHMSYALHDCFLCLSV